MTPMILSIAATILALHLSVGILRQALSHLELKSIQRRLADLPNDKTVLRSPGMPEAAYLVTPEMDLAFPENRGWFAARLMGTWCRTHPAIAASLLRKVPIAEASVFDIRMLAAALRKSWIVREDRELIALMLLRSFDLRQFADSGAVGTQEASTSAPDSRP
jgi:hypothetical protein